MTTIWWVYTSNTKRVGSSRKNYWRSVSLDTDATEEPETEEDEELENEIQQQEQDRQQEQEQQPAQVQERQKEQKGRGKEKKQVEISQVHKDTTTDRKTNNANDNMPLSSSAEDTTATTRENMMENEGFTGKAWLPSSPIQSECIAEEKNRSLNKMSRAEPSATLSSVGENSGVFAVDSSFAALQSSLLNVRIHSFFRSHSIPGNFCT